MTGSDTMSRARAAFERCYNGVISFPEGELLPGSYGNLNMKMIADTWGADSLSMRDKRLFVLALLIGSRSDPSLFLIHARSALKNNELTTDEIRTAINFGLFYTGTSSTSIIYQQFENMVAQEKPSDDD